jgi:membrane protein
LTTAPPRFGRLASSPAGLSARSWAAAFRDAARGFVDDGALGLSQQVGFSSLLAFFPAAIFAVALLGLAGLYDDLRAFLAPVAPAAVLETVDQLAADTSGIGSGLALVLGAAGALWAASGAAGTLLAAVNRAYDRESRRPFWLERLVAVGLVLVGGAVVGALLLLVVFGGPLGTAVADSVGLGGAFELAWDLARWPLALAALLVFVALVYWLAPSSGPRSWRWLTPGSVVGAVGWLALSALFALYTSFSDTYSQTYGALAGGIILLLWLQYSAVALLFGAELNAELERRAAVEAAGGSRAGLTRVIRRPAA